MDENFTDEEVAEIITEITSICEKLGWSMQLIAKDDTEEIQGILMGSDELLYDMNESSMEVPDDSEMH